MCWVLFKHPPPKILFHCHQCPEKSHGWKVSGGGLKAKSAGVLNLGSSRPESRLPFPVSQDREEKENSIFPGADEEDCSVHTVSRARCTENEQELLEPMLPHTQLFCLISGCK